MPVSVDQFLSDEDVQRWNPFETDHHTNSSTIESSSRESSRRDRIRSPFDDIDLDSVMESIPEDAASEFTEQQRVFLVPDNMSRSSIRSHYSSKRGDLGGISVNNIENPVNSNNDKGASDTDKRLFWKKKWNLIFICLFLSALIGLVVIMVIHFGKNDESNNETNIDAREIAITDILSDISDTALIAQPGTAQNNAKEWIVNVDTLQLTPSSSDPVSNAKIIQRYILAVFYFSLGGPTSWSTNNWLRNDECTEDVYDFWKGIDCTDFGEVRAIAFDNAGLVGTIPNEVGHLRMLESFILKNNPGLSGPIPSTVGQLSALSQIGLYNNNISGEIPRELYSATRLNYINLHNNQLKGQISVRIEQLHKLNRLILSNNQMTGQLPMRNIAKTNVNFLDLSHNFFSGRIEYDIGLLSNMEYFYINNNKLTGQISFEFGELKKLKLLDVSDNKLNGRIPKGVGGLADMSFLMLQNNLFSGPIPDEVNFMANLQILNVGNNSLSGRIPDISNLNQLVHFYAYENKLGGPVHKSIFNLKQLETLFLSSNSLTGTIPLEMALLGDSLKGLYLSDNQFSGSVSGSVCYLDKLEALFLDENKMIGSIPGCLGGLTELRQLHLFKNQFTGEVPSTLQNLFLLDELGLEGNNLEGKIPQAFCASNSDLELWADCGGKNPAIQCGACCSVCCPFPGKDC